MSGRIRFRVRPMLATLVREPFDAPGWVYEEKYDGYRILAYKEGVRVTLLSRNEKNRTAIFSNVAKAVATLPADTALLDGEVVSFDRRNVFGFRKRPCAEGQDNKSCPHRTSSSNPARWAKRARCP